MKDEKVYQGPRGSGASLGLTGRWRLEKFASRADYRRGRPYQVLEGKNLFLNAGKTEMWNLLIGASTNHYDASNAQIGIGDDKTTSPDASQTDLQGSQKTYKGMDSGYPAVSGASVEFRATFGSDEANYEWGEFVVRHAASGICLNRSTNGGAGWGTKSSGSVWTFTVTLTIS
jgi:hypothetical protein